MTRLFRSAGIRNDFTSFLSRLQSQGPLRKKLYAYISSLMSSGIFGKIHGEKRNNFFKEVEELYENKAISEDEAIKKMKEIINEYTQISPYGS